MNNTLKIKILAAAVIIICSMALWAAVGGKNASKNTNSVGDTIVVVKKYGYANPQRAATVWQAAQKICREFKQAAAESSGNPIYAPVVGDNLNIEDIIKLDDITVTEYFSGSNYARYEEGQTWHPSYNNKEMDKRADTEYYCRMIPKNIKLVTIVTNKENIEISEKDGQGSVLVTKKDASDQVISNLNIVPKDMLVYKIPNSSTECLTKQGLMACYFKDSPLHAATGREIILHDVIPESGQNPVWDSGNTTSIDNIVGRSNTGFVVNDIVKVYQFKSIQASKYSEIDKFKIPGFAKNYKITEQ